MHPPELISFLSDISRTSFYTRHISLFSCLLFNYDKRMTCARFAYNYLFFCHDHELILKTNDYCAIPQQLKDQLSERYAGARGAYLKTGGDFPFLSRPDEVNLHLQLHLRRVGVEARPDLVRSIPEGGLGGSPSKESGGDPDESSKDDEGSSESPSAESNLPFPSQSSESNNLDNQPPENSSENCHMVHQVMLHLFPDGFTERKHIVPPEVLALFIWERFLRSSIHHICSLVAVHYLEPFLGF